MARLIAILALALAVLPRLAAAQDDRTVRLYAPDALVGTGVMDYILPRFSLKTQIRVTLADAPDAADIVVGDEGRPLFEGERVWRMRVLSDGHAATERFADWLAGDIGRKAVLAYQPDGKPVFTEATPETREVAAIAFDGDAALGHQVSLSQCTRCHAVDEDTRGAGIGSTPSFAVLRALPDWEQRFTAFYALNPHPAFTIIHEVTPPFDESRPSPIVPIALTLDEVEAVLAYVAGMQAADLGAPLAHQ
ncbi:hypothetical protein [Citreimonas salinaria]|uniref:Cytochrome c domain-containing protein n=1 Tax=Citreimonas salinaria TaxID=321339 RepID=A0A1H3F0N0_9RHOB|nr:hypothetical protein [Citreimonas salinaria]SDX84367.1 hypothetical protein SAMN05444340_10199 [Citreimonas salinaria]